MKSSDFQLLIDESNPAAIQAHQGEHGDAAAIEAWLSFVLYRNMQTARSYKAEITRFRIFLEVMHANSPHRPAATLMRDATEMDVAMYEAQLMGKTKAGKPVPTLFIPTDILHRHNKTEQLFQRAHMRGGVTEYQGIALKASSVNQAITILHALYQYWMRPDPQTRQAYVGANPVKRIKGSTNRAARQTNRNFSAEAIAAIMQNLSLRMANQDSEMERQRIQRSRWIVALLFGLWGRRAEISSLRMNDFFHDGNRWNVRMHRKGDKEQILPIAPWVMHELVQYRQSLGLSALPNTTDNTPAIARLRSRGSHADALTPGGLLVSTINADTLYRDVTACAQSTANALRSEQILNTLDAVERARLADQLECITPHWFRHSGASIAINSGAMSLENASKMLGHSSTTITSEMYYHPDDAQIVEGMQKIGVAAFS